MARDRPRERADDTGDPDMSETPRDRGESSEPQESGEFRDPTAPAYDELAAPGSETPGERTEDVTWSTPGWNPAG